MLETTFGEPSRVSDRVTRNRPGRWHDWARLGTLTPLDRWS